MTAEPTIERPTIIRYGVLGALCAAAIAYLSRNVLGVAANDGRILSDLKITDDQLSIVMGTAFFTSYALGQIPGGWLGQRFGSRRVLPWFALLWSICTLIAGFSTSLTALFIIYVMIGACQAGLFPNSAKTISNWFPSSRTAIVCGALGSFMSIGGALAMMTTGVMLEWVSWRWVLVVFSIPGFAWAIWFYVWFRDEPGQHTSVNASELSLIQERTEDESREADDDSATATDERKPIPWLRLLTSYTLWMISGQQIFRAIGYVFYSTWFPKYLTQTRGVTTTESAFLSSLPLIAVVIAGISGGWLVDKIYQQTGSKRFSRQFVGIASMFTCALFLLDAYFVTEATAAVLLISAGSFCGTFAGPCAYAVAIDTAGDHVPICFSTMNMAGNFAAALCPTIVTTVVGLTGSWEPVLFIFVGNYILATICWALINPDRPVVAE